MVVKLPLSDEDVIPMAHDLLLVCRNHMGGRELSPQNVFVTLNAVAITAASLLAGTADANGVHPAPGALSFFNDALSRQCRELTGGKGDSLNG